MARRIGAWRSLVARLLWEQEAGGSNPSAPTNVFNTSAPPAQLSVQPASWEWSQAPTLEWESKSLLLMPWFLSGLDGNSLALEWSCALRSPQSRLSLQRSALISPYCQVNGGRRQASCRGRTLHTIRQTGVALGSD